MDGKLHCRILVVDDEESMREVLSIVLENAGYETLTASSADEAIAILDKELVDVVLTDLYMGREREAGLRLLAYLNSSQPMTPAIMITAHGTVQSAVEAMRLGALDYLQKPFNSNEEVLLRVARAIEKRRLVRENQAFRQEQARNARLDTMVGSSPAFSAVLDMVRRVAALPSTVAIYGESGVGKELIARALHTLSPRAGKPFVAINCGGIPETLLESELFGYKKGAFTGATQDKEGLFVVADGGTLFLDEIGEMPPMLQVKLLRVLDNNCITPVGGLSSTQVDVRVISATNRNLDEMVETHQFRTDLYYRLNVIPITIPPLRERVDDIPQLARFLLARHAAAMNCAVKQIAPEVENALARYSWPGNVRELSNVLERALGLSQQDEIVLEDMPPCIRAEATASKNAEACACAENEGTTSGVLTNPPRALAAGQTINLEKIVADMEADCIRQALQLGRHSHQKAAELLGITPRALRHRISKYKLSDS